MSILYINKENCENWWNIVWFYDKSTASQRTACPHGAALAAVIQADGSSQ